MKAIQITIDEDLLKQIDQWIRKKDENRSAFIRDSIHHYIHSLQVQQLEEKHRLGYQKYPVYKKEFNKWHREQIWGNE